jgi:uncharacterized coiled-coil protein SlyX
MLLNEFLKEHCKVQEQENAIAELKNEVTELATTLRRQAAQIQKVNEQLESSEAVVRILADNQ